MKVMGAGRILVLVGAACGQPTAMDTVNASSEGSSTASTGEPGATEADASSASASDSTSEAPTTGSGAVCGDGVVGGDEECDDGNSVATDACLPDCSSATCGDLVVQLGVEECDDGDQDNTDNCTNACQFAICGDGIVGPGEGCDDGDDIDTNQCSNDCIVGTCGDGDIQPGEECDEGIETAECNIDCTQSMCGDGVPNSKAGEECDDGGESVTCNADCSVAACGDGKLNISSGEACDDGGESATCNIDCSEPLCGDGMTNTLAGEECDEEGVASASCDGDCSLPTCGDGEFNPNAQEECDDGDTEPGDACSSSCTNTKIVQLAPGHRHTCILLASGVVRCWGLYTALGLETFNTLGDQPGELPTPDLKLDGKATSLTSGFDFSCAVVEGDVRCWGKADYGKLGYGNTSDLGTLLGDMPPPPLALGPVDAVQIDAGTWHTCAVFLDKTVRCWGSGVNGGLGSGNTNNIGDNGGEMPPLPLQGIDQAKHIVAGGDGIQNSQQGYTCLLQEDGTVRCWGTNASGQLAIQSIQNVGDGPGEIPPALSKLGGNAKQVAAGVYHACALMETGNVRCWGAGESGALGTGSQANIGDGLGEVPSDVALGEPVTAVSAGNRFTCALTASGKVKCWGRGMEGQLGYGKTMDVINLADIPVNGVDLGGTATMIASGIGHTCAVLSDDTLRCWGYGSDGVLGYGSGQTVGDNETPVTMGPVPF